MGKQYIVKGAMAQCNQSKVPMIAQLNLIPDNMFVNMNGNPVATTMTLGPVFGPAPFGICNMIPPTPAVPTPPCVCAILSWSGADTAVKINMISSPLTTDSKGTCALGGSISFKMSGQFPKPSIPPIPTPAVPDMNAAAPKPKEKSKKNLTKTRQDLQDRPNAIPDSLKKTVDELSSTLKRKDDGDSIIFIDSNENVIAEITNGNFVVKKWGVHYSGKVEKKLDNGYWLVSQEKDGNKSYSIDLGFKEGRTLTGKEVNNYFVETGRSAPYSDDCEVSEEILPPNTEIEMVIDGYRTNQITGELEPNYKPGGWASKDSISTIEELRKDMAVLSSWKKEENKPTSVKYKVLKDLPVRNGIIGPQEENGVIYPGGNQQYEIICTKDMRWRDDGWEDYLQEISRKELK